MPHAFTWNIGTMSNTASCADKLIASGNAATQECSTVERWLYKTPFGLSVVADV